jgi:hypothetical protein
LRWNSDEEVSDVLSAVLRLCARGGCGRPNPVTAPEHTPFAPNRKSWYQRNRALTLVNEAVLELCGKADSFDDPSR